MATNQHALPSRPLKSTAAPRNLSAFPPQTTPALPPLAPGWTEHKAPTGHSYFYNAATKTSTYVRPVATPAPQAAYPFAAAMGAIPGQQRQPPPQFFQQQQQQRQNPSFRGPRFGSQQNINRPPFNRKPEKPDRPKKKQGIPGVDKWVLVTTKQGREFVHNVETKESLWKAPEELRDALDKFKAMSVEDKEAFQKEWNENRQREKARAKGKAVETKIEETPQAAAGGAGEAVAEGEMEGNEDEYEEEYEEYEEYEDGEGDEYEYEDEETPLRTTRKRSASAAAASDTDPSDPSTKRHKHTPPPPHPYPSGPVEFTEDDIAWQLESLADEYGLTTEDLEPTDLPPADAVHIFTEMLDALAPNPYHTFDHILPSLLPDPRYTVLATTKLRQQVFSSWAKARIAHLNEIKSQQPKLDPKIPFLEFLRDKIPNGTKLYWQEFRRKWKKEKCMRDPALSDRDREKCFREYSAHVKASPAILENDLLRLLKKTRGLSRDTTLDALPQDVRIDTRYAAFPPPAASAPASAQTREAVIQKYLSTLPSQAEVDAALMGGGDEAKEAEGGLSRAEQALRERERAVRREKWRVERDIERGRELVEEGGREIERAKMIGRKGLASHFVRPGEEEEGGSGTPTSTSMTPVPPPPPRE
ncbi:hypothetical protein DFH27DRAFT_288753 [Peziza echinospora]|nr:hypothetical protein DFH27DRAFT_288753 [Peziza echinospora]